MRGALPHVILHNAVSLDGRLDGFEADPGLYYETAGALGAQAILAGSTTILTGFAAAPEEDPPSAVAPASGSDDRPLLAIVDSRGRIDIWERIRRQPYWRGVVALASQATPAPALARERVAGVETIVAGRDHVDLAAALQTMAERYAVRTVRVDGGGRLNGALLQAGLVNEISLLIHPVLAGAAGTLPLVAGRLPERVLTRAWEDGSAKAMRGGVLWLRYAIAREGLG